MTAVIEVFDLRKSFNGLMAVKDVSLTVFKGDIFGFLGPNGSGKTTTIRLLCGLLTPDSGRGHCLGYDILSQSYEIKQEVGYMTQRFSLYEDLSVYENLSFIARLYNVPDRKFFLEEIIERFQLTQRINQLVGHLSGGWKQRLALACALLHKPKLLLLDEPTAGVDPKARRDFWAQVHQLSLEGITTLVSTHYMDEAERCTKLAFINQGKILARGKPQSLIAQSLLFTFQMQGENLFALVPEIEKLPGVDFVLPFGTILHICGRDEDLLKKSLSVYKQCTISKIETTLEDLFIQLMGKANDNEI